MEWSLLYDLPARAGLTEGATWVQGGCMSGLLGAATAPMYFARSLEDSRCV
jgi:hypothetical protein